MSNTNAKQEFIKHVGDRKVKCVLLEYGYYCDEDKRPKLLLKLNHGLDDYVDFLERLNFNYDSGYGGQELYGTIWYEDGTWSDRGSEWWRHNECPEVPDELKPMQLKGE